MAPIKRGEVTVPNEQEGDQEQLGQQGQQGQLPLTLRAAQAEVDASIQALGGYWPPLANLARLFEECGELARAINQAEGPKRVKPGEIRAAVAEEIGDVLYTLLVLANSLGQDAEDALAAALAKTHTRASRGASPGAE